MKFRRLRLRLAALIAAIVVVLAMAPLLIWRSDRAEAIEQQLDNELVWQMNVFHRYQRFEEMTVDELWFPAYVVNPEDEWFEEVTDFGLEPPLITWAQEAGEWPGFREFSLDNDDEFRGFIQPIQPLETFIVLTSTRSFTDEISSLNRRTALFGVLFLAIGALAGWVISGLALGPSRRMLDSQQGFLADAAHEMRTPLAVITASSSQALARPRSEQEYVRSLSEIRSAAERASTGVNELLDLVRFDSGQAIPRLAPLRLDLLAEEVAAATIVDDGERRVEVIAEPTAPVVVSADMALVRQALDNIVRNAVRRADRVELTSSIDGRFGVVEVADNGPGFDPAMLPHVFERYRRGDRRGETGIGLAIVKAIVEANGGTVTARNAAPSDSAQGGAVIRLALPLDQ